MLNLLFVAVLCSGFVNADQLVDISSLGCLNVPLISPEQQPELRTALNLNKNYKLVVRYTDHILNTTAKISESNFTDILVIRKEQNAVDETFIVGNKTIHYKDGECSVDEPTSVNTVYNVTGQLRTLFKNQTANMVEILNGIDRTNFDYGKLDENIKFVDGINVASWTGCINQTVNSSAVEIVVEYATEKSKPSYSDYANPKVVSVRLIAYKVNNTANGTKVNVTESLSFNIVELEHTRPEHKQKLSQVPRGLFCKNMTKAKLPAKLPKRFHTQLEYVDTEKRMTDKVDLTYDEANRIVSFALDFDRDSDVPYVQNSAPTKIKGKARVIQDFKSGFEYILSRDGRVCNQVEPIQKTWANVREIENKLLLRDPTGAFFNISQRPVYYAGEVIEEGVTYQSYVSRKYVDSTAKDYIVVELLFTLPDWSNEDNKEEQQIHSIVQYHKNANHSLIKTTVIRFNSFQNNSNGISWSNHGVQSCMLDVPADNFFFFKMADVKMKDIQNYGYENVETALVETIAQTTNISVLRISPFLFKTVEGELLACFLLGEKNNNTPAQTKSLLNEKTIQEVRQQLNDTLQTQRISVNVFTDDKKQVKLSLTALGMVSTNQVQPIRKYYGFSGGSMFILGIFMFIFGAGGAVGAYLLYMKRQNIRGIAYQVFE